MKKKLLIVMACTLFLAQAIDASFFKSSRKLKKVLRAWKKLSIDPKYVPSFIVGTLWVWAILHKKHTVSQRTGRPANGTVSDQIQSLLRLQESIFHQIFMQRGIPFSPELLDLFIHILANEIIIDQELQIEDDVPYAPTMGQPIHTGWDHIDPIPPPLAEPSFGPLPERSFDTWRHLPPQIVNHLLEQLEAHKNSENPQTIINELVTYAQDQACVIPQKKDVFQDSLSTYLQQKLSAIQSGQALPKCIICLEHTITDLPQACVACPNCNNPYHHSCISDWEYEGQGTGGCPLCRHYVEYENIQPPMHLSTAIIPFIQPDPL